MINTDQILSSASAERRGHVASWTIHRIVSNSSTPGALEIKQSDAHAAIEYLADRVRVGGLNSDAIYRLEGIAW